MNIEIDKVCSIAVEAGHAILEVYQKDFDVEYKDDYSPLTEADKASHQIIERELLKRYPEIPVLSEEGKGIPYPERRNWERFWLVDPLDGTKEFIKRNGEFTVNIALIEGYRPAAGVIYIPVEDRLFYGIVGEGAWSRNGDGETVPIHVRESPSENGLVVVQSRSHPSEALRHYLGKLNIRESIARGSSLKLCAVADGSADIYPRLGPTWEWDTAAGHAIVEAAGGHVVDLKKMPLRYNKEVIKNDHFIVVSDLGLMP
ncbi:MAG: 3'(2'),5'-bisphosphate nucleotidase CysQ [Deltaproteobacteria bacterium]|nr:3'(2'),5'-bisphosphate nucleotidase CysQ [Deltaproteobacteria bacterium]